MGVAVATNHHMMLVIQIYSFLSLGLDAVSILIDVVSRISTGVIDMLVLGEVAVESI